MFEKWKKYGKSPDPLHDMVLDSNISNATDNTKIDTVNSPETSSDVKKIENTIFSNISDVKLCVLYLKD